MRPLQFLLPQGLCSNGGGISYPRRSLVLLLLQRTSHTPRRAGHHPGLASDGSSVDRLAPIGS